MDFDSLGVPDATAIHDGVRDGVCAWCRTPLAGSPDDLLCPHVFLLPGRRAYQVARLAEVFQCYDVRSVIAYLRIVAEGQSGPRRRARVYESIRKASEQTIRVHWRDRSWIFDFAWGDDVWRVGAFRLTVRQRGRDIEQAAIAPPTLHGGLVVTLIKTRT